MTTPTRIYALTPALNESGALRELLPELDRTLRGMGFPFTICVVDDGSSDGMQAVAQGLAKEGTLHYLRHETNQGYGAALRTGIYWIVQNARPEDILITLDADNTHPPSFIPALVARVQAGAEVVTASYTVPGGASRGIPLQRKIFSRGVNTLFRLRFWLPGVTTYTNGFRAYRVSALQAAWRRHGERLIEETRFAGGTELFLKVLRAGAAAGELPFELRYDRRGTSKIRIFDTIRSYLKLLQ